MPCNSEHVTQQAGVNKYFIEAEEKSNGTMFAALLAQVFLEKVEEHELKDSQRTCPTIAADAESTYGKYEDLKAYLHDAYLKDVSLYKA